MKSERTPSDVEVAPPCVAAEPVDLALERLDAVYDLRIGRAQGRRLSGHDAAQLAPQHLRQDGPDRFGGQAPGSHLGHDLSLGLVLGGEETDSPPHRFPREVRSQRHTQKRLTADCCNGSTQAPAAVEGAAADLEVGSRLGAPRLAGPRQRSGV